jgi:hypothetical protein
MDAAPPAHIHKQRIERSWHCPPQAANKPFWGVQGAYARATDPWLRPGLNAFRRSYYERALVWLAEVRLSS